MSRVTSDPLRSPPAEAAFPEWQTCRRCGERTAHRPGRVRLFRTELSPGDGGLGDVQLQEWDCLVCRRRQAVVERTEKAARLLTALVAFGGGFWLVRGGVPLLMAIPWALVGGRFVAAVPEDLARLAAALRHRDAELGATTRTAVPMSLLLGGWFPAQAWLLLGRDLSLPASALLPVGPLLAVAFTAWRLLRHLFPKGEGPGPAPSA